MKHGIIRISVLLLAALITTGALMAQPASKFFKTEGDKIAGEYVVVFHQDRLPMKANDMAKSLAATHRAELGPVWEDALKGALFTGMTERQAIELSRHPMVRFVEENGIVTTDAFQINPPSWGLDRIDQRNLPLDNRYGFTATGACVRANIIDSGILSTHVDFGGRVDPACSANFSGAPSACDGHGTHVAGTAGGNRYGVAKGVRLCDVQVLNCGGSGSFAQVISGVNFVTSNAATHMPCPSVANMSLGGPPSVAVDNAVVSSINSGVAYSIAAGNFGGSASLASPARVGGLCGPAITVGSSTINDSVSGFSAFGTCVDLFAPGSAITSAWNTSNTASATSSGTSMAAPHVTGTAALFLAGNLTATPAQVKTAINNGATVGVLSGVPPGTPNRLLFSLINSCPGP